MDRICGPRNNNRIKGVQVLQPILDPMFSAHYVRSRRAGKRVMALLLKLYGRLRLTVNATKSAAWPSREEKAKGALGCVDERDTGI